MSEPRPKGKLAVVDENFELPADLQARPPEERLALKGQLRDANNIKEGRRRQLADDLKALGAQTLADASQLAQIRAERDARPTVHSYHRHGMARLFQGAFLGMCAGVIVAFFLLPIVANAVSGLLHEATITGAMVSSQREPAPQYQRQP